MFLLQDKLMTAPSDSSGSGSSGNWLFKNKEHGKASAAASLVVQLQQLGLFPYTWHLGYYVIMVLIKQSFSGNDSSVGF
jgi:hypothetical protein